jgi:hypothetical protein
MGLNAVEWVGIAAGVGIAGFVGYKLYEANQNKVPDFSAIQHQLVYGPSYIAAVNKAGGFNDTLMQNGTMTAYRVFVEGSYGNGTTFQPNGKVYVYQPVTGVPAPSGSKGNGYYTTMAAILAAGYTFAALQSSQTAVAS